MAGGGRDRRQPAVPRRSSSCAGTSATSTLTGCSPRGTGRWLASPTSAATGSSRRRRAIEAGRAKRVGLLATQAIRGGANRRVLQRIKETGDIFYAQADRKWIQDGVAVRVSMVGL